MTNYTRHVGIVVHNLIEARYFWEKIIGFDLHVDAVEKSPYIDELIGIAKPNLRTVKFKDANGFTIELLEFSNYSSSEKWDGDLKTTGLTHIALTVKNVELIVGKLKEKGYETVSQILNSPDGKVKVVFIEGPEGLMIELVEELNL